jgi:hypothetical protein
MARRAKSKEPTTAGRHPDRKAAAADYDSPWKEALDSYFAACMALFFPKVYADIDWSRGHEALDKELQPIVRRARSGRRYVDKLVKVWLNTGEERWLLIHVEVQSQKEGDFPVRMHVYNHRIFDRYGHEVVSLAILADDDPSWRPGRYEYSRWGFRTVTEFPVVKLLDYAGQYKELEADPNPFAVVLLAHLKALETRQSPAERYTWKMRLVKGLYGRGMDREDVRRLFNFIDWVMELPEPLDGRFRGDINAFQQEKRMPFMNTFDRAVLRDGLLRGIEALLEVRFGTAGLELMPEIRQIHDHVVLDKVLTKIKTAASLDDVRRVWTRKRRPKAAKSE